MKRETRRTVLVLALALELAPDPAAQRFIGRARMTLSDPPPPAALTITTTTLPTNQTVDMVYPTTPIEVAGAVGTPTCVFTGGTPPGLALSSCATGITGTQTTIGSYSPCIQATDSQGSSPIRCYTVVIVPIASPDPDFGGYRPHYQGYGVTTPGGRGGTVIKVTNLNDSGAGSLRAALTASGARFVVYETSGTIALNSDIFITSPFLTVAGQTAPSPGITVKNRSIWIQTNNVVLQHFRQRMGDVSYTGACSEADAIYVQNGAYNIVLDHMSVSWSTHEGIGYHAFTGPEVHDVALLDSIISENLKKIQCGGSIGVSLGALFYANTAAGATSYGTIARNIFAHNGNRNPWISTGWQTSIYNNISYNPFGQTNDTDLYGFVQFVGCGYPTSNPFRNVTVGNLFIAGPDTHADVKSVKMCLTAAQVPGSSVYLADNTGPFMTLGDQWGGVTFCAVGQCGGGNAATEANVKIMTLPSWHTAFNFVVLPNASVSASVRASAGARPLDRDAVDTRVVADITQLDGALITSQTAVGGWPTLAVNSQTYTIPANPNNPGTCGTATGGIVRTIIECDLENRAKALEP